MIRKSNLPTCLFQIIINVGQDMLLQKVFFRPLIMGITASWDILGTYLVCTGVGSSFLPNMLCYYAANSKRILVINTLL